MRSNLGFTGHRAIRARTAEGPRRIFRSGKKLLILTMTIGIVAVMAMVLVPAEKSSAFPGRTGGACNSCHTGPLTESLLVVTGLPSVNYNPGQVYDIVVNIADVNGGVGENSFDLIVTGGGTLSTTDTKVTIVSDTEATTDSGTGAAATSWTLKWTAPSSGSVTIAVWGVAGDGATGKLDPYDTDSFSFAVIPEFPVLLLPVIGVVATVLVAAKISKKSR
jgi:hypothetical protein